MIVGFRLGRRLLAVVAIEDETITFCDSRFVATNRVERGIPRYFDQVLSQLKPSAICYYAPTSAGSVTERLAALLTQSASRIGLTAMALTKQDLFGSFAV